MSYHCVILLLVTLMMVSGILVPCVRAANPLVVDFYAVPQSGVLPLDVQFWDATIPADPANNTYLWTFGDGNSSIEINPPHTYITSGTYSVNLTVTEITGNNATLSKPYYIHVADTVNATDFSGTPQCGLSPLLVQFIDGTTLPHDQWEWNFGDGGASNLSDPQYTYNGEGSWTVSLYIWNNSGGPQSIISKTDYIRVIPVGVASFSASGTGNANPLTVQFNDISTGFISPVTYHWDFGDGGKSADQNPLHTYSNVSGLYNVTFTVADTCGQVITDTGSVIVSEGSVVFQTQSVSGHPGAPVADFTGIPTSGAAPLDVAFADTSLNNPTSWNWSFGDGYYSAISNPVHTYASNGNYTVSLIATNPMGSSTKTRIEYITVPGFLLAPPAGPFVNFTGTPTYGIVPLTVQFTDFSYGFQEPITYLWDFGDGSTSTTRNASHIYTTTGLHSVSLTVSGSDGQTATEVKPGYINTVIPTIEIILGTESMDQSLLVNEPVPTTQSTPQAQSVPLAKSGLQATSSSMVQSISQSGPEYQGQPVPKDSSPENGLQAANPPPFDVKQPSVFLSLNRSINNKFDHAFWMMIKCGSNWRVMVYNDESNKPAPAGHLAEYNLSQSSYVSSGNVLLNPLYLQSESQLSGDLSPLSGPIALASKPGGILQEGPPFNTLPFKYFINLEQMVDHDDKRPGPGNQYRVVITFEAQTL